MIGIALEGCHLVLPFTRRFLCLITSDNRNQLWVQLTAIKASEKGVITLQRMSYSDTLTYRQTKDQTMFSIPGYALRHELRRS